MNEEALKLTLSSSPHAHSPNSTRRIMLDVCIALLPALIGAIVFFGARALPLPARGVGGGVGGELPGAGATVEIMRHIQRTRGVRVVRHSDIASPEVRRVAVCTGAGASMIGEARRAGADIYITADMKYNDFMTPDKALTVADIGHFESEYCAIQILFDILSKNLITFAVRKSEDSRNPVNYLV